MENISIRYNSSNIAFLGKKQSGKTYFVKFLIKNIPKEKVYVLDTNRSFSSEYKHRFITNTFTPAILDKFIRVVLSENEGGKRQFLTVLDDIDVYTPLASSLFQSFNINSRNNGIGVFWTAKRPKRVSLIIFENADYLFLGKGLLGTDLQYISNSFDIDVNAYNQLNQYEFLVYSTADNLNMIVKAGQI